MARTDPPQPPPFQRKIIIGRVQAIGVGVLCLIVIAAVAGLLGLKPGHARAAGAGLEVEVQYPRILRYKTSLPLEIRIRNTAGQALANVEVQIARPYLDGFQDVHVTPGAREITERHYRVARGGHVARGATQRSPAGERARQHRGPAAAGPALVHDGAALRSPAWTPSCASRSST
jgi:hypothetical protein